MNDLTVYNQVIDQAKNIRTLETILELLTWDQETIMPPAGNGHRSEQKAQLAGIIHEKKSCPSYFEQIRSLAACTTLDADTTILMKRLYRDVSLARKLPTPFVQIFSRASSEAFEAWQNARRQNSWVIFEPHLTKLVELSRQKAEYLGYKDHPLDALLDEYEPEATTAEINVLFSSLKTKLQSLLKEIKESPQYGKRRTPISSTSSDQLSICRDIVSLIGFDWNKGRIDTSEHPFSTGIHPTDTRITIRRHSNDLLDQVMSAMHEAGHSFYERGLDPNHFGTPLAESASLSIHESQSRLWETVIGRSRPFIGNLFTILQRHYQNSPPFSSQEDLYTELNRVECSFIRTQADEVTYPLHVILRFEIEKELIDGSLSVHDVPQRWNDGMKDLLGIIPANDTEGCLQDVHWSMGSFGYFPTYTLGSLYAVCFYEAMKKEIPTIEELLRKGTFAPIHAWLHDHVWSHGRRFLSRELVTKALGRSPTEDDYINYLRAKYL